MGKGGRRAAGVPSWGLGLGVAGESSAGKRPLAPAPLPCSSTTGSSTVSASQQQLSEGYYGGVNGFITEWLRL